MSRSFDFRLAAAVILLLPAIWFSWKTVDGLAAAPPPPHRPGRDHARALRYPQRRPMARHHGPDTQRTSRQARSQRTEQESPAHGGTVAVRAAGQHQDADDVAQCQGVGHARRGQRHAREHDRRIAASPCAGIHQRGDGGASQPGNAKELQGLHPQRPGRCGQEHVRRDRHDHL